MPNSDISYYKIIDSVTGEIECYLTSSLPIKPDKVCEVLNLSSYHAESISREEYERGTEENE